MKIEQAWKLASFELVNYRKNAVEEKDKQYVLKTPDDIRQLLEDNILILQSLSASKYVRAIKQRVTEWERDLN
jgi:adenylate kinase